MLLLMLTPRRQPGSRRRLLVSLLLAAAGLAVLVWTIERIDLDIADLRAGFANVGWWFGAILLLAFVRFLLRARAWTALTGPHVPLRAAVAATISGDAVGNVTPLGLIASEPAKAYYLQDYAAPSETLASLVAENFFYSVSVAVYVIVAAAAMFAFFDLPPAIALAGQVSLAGMAVILAGAGWLAFAKPALVSGVIARLPGTATAGLAAKLRTFEDRVYGVAGRGRRALAIVAACDVGFHLLSLVECWLTFWLLAGETSILPALVFDGFNRVANVVFKAIPLRVGVEEGGTALIAAAIGLAAGDGFMLGIVRKVRMVVWAAVGIALAATRTARAPAKYEVGSTKYEE